MRVRVSEFTNTLVNSPGLEYSKSYPSRIESLLQGNRDRIVTLDFAATEAFH